MGQTIVRAFWSILSSFILLPDLFVIPHASIGLDPKEVFRSSYFNQDAARFKHGACCLALFHCHSFDPVNTF